MSAMAVILAPATFLVVGSSAAGAATISVTVHCTATKGQCKLHVRPLWDEFNNCVEENYTRAFDVDLNAQQFGDIHLSVGTRCAFVESRMHWRVEVQGHPDLWQDIELRSLNGTVTSRCGPQSLRWADCIQYKGTIVLQSSW
jgi:hypothetical protein